MGDHSSRKRIIVTRINRRKLFTLAGGAACTAGLGWAWHRHRQTTFRIGLIGCGMRGTQLAGLINDTFRFDRCGQIVAICDVERSRAEAARTKYAPRAEVTDDFQRVLERDDIDAVFIATPDHWHAPCALAALRANKHVYCEKPMTLTIAEGQQLIAAANACDRTFIVGTQQRSHRSFQQACELVRNGRLGQLKSIDISLPTNHTGGPFAVGTEPATLNWERWLGPAPYADYCLERFKIFRGWYDYSGGSMTDWGAHNLDIAHWAMDLDESGPIEISGEAVLPNIKNGFDIPGSFAVEMKYPNNVTVRIRSNAKETGVLFQGDEGRIHVSRRCLTGKPFEELSSNPLPPDSIHLGHERTTLFNSFNISHVLHFFDCIATGQTPISDVGSQHRSASACHLANIAIRLGRPVQWNPTSEQFVDDPDATAMISRSSRTA
jgi:predicted dehydrogenase